MPDKKLPPVETKFAELIWKHAPVTTLDLIKLCAEHFHWNRSTTYTVLRRLCEKGLFQTEHGLVTVLIAKEEYESTQSEQFVEETFHGSLPAFLVSFAAKRKFTDAEIEELHKVVDRMREQ